LDFQSTLPAAIHPSERSVKRLFSFGETGGIHWGGD